MRPTDPITLLACAIATEEGYFTPGTIPSIRKNPGDLRFAGQIGAQTPPPSNKPSPIATFDTVGHGVAALYRQIWKYVAEGKTVRQIIEIWAPPTENNTSSYVANVLQWTRLPGDVPVLELLPPLERLT